MPINVLLPARYAEASKLQRIAVLKFSGERGDQLTTKFESMLTSTLIDEKPYFTIIERRKLKQVLKEIQRGQQGLISASSAARIGKFTGAQGVYTGLSDVSIKQRPYSETRKKCRNLVDGKCFSWSNYKVSCNQVDVSFTLTPRLIEVQTGHVVYSKTHSDSKSIERCSDQGASPSEDAMLREMEAAVFEQIRLDVSPHYAMLELRLKELDRDNPASELHKNQFQGAIDFAKSGRMPRACEIWDGLKNQITGQEMLFNQAVCKEIQGDLVGAKELIYEVDRILVEPDDDVNEFITRIEQRIISQEKVTKQSRKSPRKRQGQNSKASALVKKIQRNLNKLSYDAGPEDGAMGQRTRAAIKNFQLDMGLKETGKATEKLLKALQAETGT